MKLTSPWYISAHAVKRYLALMQRPAVEDGPTWDRAEHELMVMAWRVVLNVHADLAQARPVADGLVKYRGPRPLRLGLMVATRPRPEGPLPQLVDVLPSHEGGLGAGLKRSPSRQRRHERRRARALESGTNKDR